MIQKRIVRIHGLSGRHLNRICGQRVLNQSLTQIAISCLFSAIRVNYFVTTKGLNKWIAANIWFHGWHRKHFWLTGPSTPLIYQYMISIQIQFYWLLANILSKETLLQMKKQLIYFLTHFINEFILVLFNNNFNFKIPSLKNRSDIKFINNGWNGIHIIWRIGMNYMTNIETWNDWWNESYIC